MFRDDEIEKELLLIECFIAAIELIRSPTFKKTSPSALHNAILQELVARPEYAECPLVSQLSPNQDDDSAFLGDLEKNIALEDERAKMSGDGLRKVFSYVNKVSKLTTIRRTPVQMVVLNRCIEVLKQWFNDWARKHGGRSHKKRSEKNKTLEPTSAEEVADFLKHVHLESNSVKQLIKLTKKVKTRLEEKAIEPNEWPFKQSINFEKKKLAENYHFFKKFLFSSNKVDEGRLKNTKDNKRKLPHNYNPHLDNSSIPKTYENMVAHVDTRGFHASLVSQFMANSDFKVDKVEANKIVHAIIEKLKIKIHDPLQFTLVVRRIIKFLKMLRSLKLEELSRFIRKTGFKTNIVGKLAGKGDDELRKLEKTRKEGGTIVLGKVRPKEVVDLESSARGLIEQKLEKRGGTITSNTGHNLSKTQKKASFDELENGLLPALDFRNVRGRDGTFLKKHPEPIPMSEADKMYEDLARKFNKRRDMILEGILDVAEVSDTNSNGNFSEEERCSIVDEPTFSSSKQISHDHYFRIFNGQLATAEGGAKRRFDAELFTVYGEDFIKNFDAMKEKTPLAFKPSAKDFQQYIDKVLLSAERAQYLILPCFVKIPEELGFVSALTKAGSVASMKYSDNCKVFIFPSFLLKPEWLDVINFILIKDNLAEQHQAPQSQGQLRQRALRLHQEVAFRRLQAGRAFAAQPGQREPAGASSREQRHKTQQGLV